MNDTHKLIVGLLENGKPELQVAAAQVLGELHVKDPIVVRALAQGMKRSPVLARFCLDALAKLATEEAIGLIARAAIESDPLGDHAAHWVAELGAPAQAMVAASYADAGLAAQKRIVALLAKHPHKEAAAVFIQALRTPELAEHAGRALLAVCEKLPQAVQKPLVATLTKALSEPLAEACHVQMLGILAALDRDGSRAAILALTGDATAPAIRSAAFRALHGAKLGAPQVRAMMDLLEDQAQKGVHDAVRDVLAALPELPEGLAPVLKRLLTARAPEQRLFALRMLRTAGGADFAKTAIKLLDHDDPRFRDAAADALSHNRQASEQLVRLVAFGRDANLAAAATVILVRQAPLLAPKFVRDLAEKAMRLLSANPKVADLLFDVVFAAGGAKLAAVLVERCVRARRVHKLAEALHVLARLTAVAPNDNEVRYQLGVTKLLHDIARPADESAPPGNSGMGFFAALLRSDYPLLDRLRKEPAITADLLFKIAAHFRSAVGPEQRFAAEALHHLATRTKGRAAADAKVALRTASA
ncbi:MAG: hypothetical protein FJ301_02920 [Planctomycetes bacterium]|nr:hypothetical protein [Planctomycetota bacterium]